MNNNFLPLLSGGRRGKKKVKWKGRRGEVGGGKKGRGCACKLITSHLKAAPFPHTSGKSFIMRWHKPCRGLLVAPRKEPGWQAGSYHQA